tara:strand:+ start:157 stop:666 length:510 start_codon:yes stop_codon:yes gene_type:complete
LPKVKVVSDKQFVWRDGTRYSVDAQAVGEQLEALEYKHGALTPDLVVREARKKTSPLHECFEWDDTRAAEKYRKYEARTLTGAVLVVTQQTAEPVRAFHSVPITFTSDDEQARGYVSLDVAINDPEHRNYLLQQAFRDLASWKKKYSELKELHGIFSQADRLIEKYSIK